jgi:2-iminobutanoate/2-iminopropanoate deaminase
LERRFGKDGSGPVFLRFGGWGWQPAAFEFRFEAFEFGFGLFALCPGLFGFCSVRLAFPSFFVLALMFLHDGDDARQFEVESFQVALLNFQAYGIVPFAFSLQGGIMSAHVDCAKQFGFFHPTYCVTRCFRIIRAIMFKTLLIASLLLMTFPASSERKVIVPANAAKPVGPYSPGLLTAEYLYVSGQGVRDAASIVPDGLKAQTRQCLENVKAIVEAAGLTMEHVVHMQLYLEKLSDLPVVDGVYAEYFPKAPPARVVIGTAKMPTDTNIEMTVVAVRDLKSKKVVSLKSLKPLGPASSAVEVKGRVYLSAVYGRTRAQAEENLKRAMREAGLKADRILLRNEYGASASAPLPMNELPEGAGVGLSVIASRNPVRRANDCAVDGVTRFCQAQSGAGEKTVEAQVKVVMKKLETALAAHGAGFVDVVATNVYLDDIREFRPMNETYATFFSAAPPTRTTVQPFAVADRSKGDPALVRISLVAVKEN